MNMKFPLVIAAAALAGLAGGWASRFLPLDSLSDRHHTIRATQILLVDERGRTRAFFGTDQDMQAAIVFLDDQGHETASFGGSNLVMNGGGGKERIRFGLSGADSRPFIDLSDHERIRVSLGFDANDVPSPKDEDWGLRFYAPGPARPFDGILASVGMGRRAQDKMLGFVYAKGKDGQEFQAPR